MFLHNTDECTFLRWVDKRVWQCTDPCTTTQDGCGVLMAYYSHKIFTSATNFSSFSWLIFHQKIVCIPFRLLLESLMDTKGKHEYCILRIFTSALTMFVFFYNAGTSSIQHFITWRIFYTIKTAPVRLNASIFVTKAFRSRLICCTCIQNHISSTTKYLFCKILFYLLHPTCFVCFSRNSRSQVINLR